LIDADSLGLRPSPARVSHLDAGLRPKTRADHRRARRNARGVLLAWFDPLTRTVEIEPLGTRPDYRRLGLGRAIVEEVLRRSAARKAKSIMVWGAHQNDVAIHLYESAGLQSRRVLREYKRVLQAPL